MPQQPKPKPGRPLPPDVRLAVLHNQFARCHTDLGVTAMRLIMLMAEQVRKDGELKPFHLKVQDYQEALDLRGKSAYQHLRAVILKLMKTVISTPKAVGGERLFQVLGETDINARGEFTLIFNPSMRPLLVSLTELFCKIPLEVFFRIQGAYAVRFYLFCKSWDPVQNDNPGWSMTVRELRDWLDFKEDEYERIYHIRQAVLERARRELDEVADVSFRYEAITEGNKTVGWFFCPVVNRPKASLKREKRAKALPPPPAPEPPAAPAFEAEVAALWANASQEQKDAWLQDEMLRHFQPKVGQKPRLAFLSRLHLLTQPPAQTQAVA